MSGSPGLRGPVFVRRLAWSVAALLLAAPALLGAAPPAKKIPGPFQAANQSKQDNPADPGCVAAGAPCERDEECCSERCGPEGFCGVATDLPELRWATDRCARVGRFLRAGPRGPSYRVKRAKAAEMRVTRYRSGQPPAQVEVSVDRSGHPGGVLLHTYRDQGRIVLVNLTGEVKDRLYSYWVADIGPDSGGCWRLIGSLDATELEASGGMASESLEPFAVTLRVQRGDRKEPAFEIVAVE